MVPEIFFEGVFCHYGPFFLFFDPPNNLKNQNFEKMKKHLIMLLSFYTGISQIMIILCMVPEMWSTTDIFFSHFAPLPL